MSNPLTPKERRDFAQIATTVTCPRCKANRGEPCIYKARNRAGANTVHDDRLLAVKKDQSVSKYGRRKGVSTEDLRPLASRRLTMREMRNCGAWVPIKDDEEEHFP